MNKLNIAIFHLAFIYSGGGEKLVLQEYEGLKKLGHKVTIFTTAIDRKKSFPDIINKYKIQTFLPNLKLFKGHEAFQTIVSCMLAPLYAHKFKGYDVILAANQPSPWIAYIIKRLYKVPYVSYLAQPTRFLHQRKIDRQTGLFFTKKASESLSAWLMMNVFKKFSDWADRVSIRSSNAILGNGEYSKKTIEEVYKVNVKTCPAGVSVGNIGRFKKENYLLITNRHFPQKKIEFAIFTLNKVLAIDPTYRLIITGSNTEYTLKLKALVNELGMQDKVDFLGYVKEKHLKELYKKATAYLYTAPEEDFGMGVIEAMGYGTPVVAWKNAGPSKIITDGLNSLLAAPFDLDDFSSKVISLVKNKRLSEKIGKEAFLHIKSEFLVKIHIKCIENELFYAIKRPLK